MVYIPFNDLCDPLSAPEDGDTPEDKTDHLRRLAEIDVEKGKAGYFATVSAWNGP